MARPTIWFVHRVTWFLALGAAAGGAAYASGNGPGWSLAAALAGPLAVAMTPAFLRGLRTPGRREELHASKAAMSGTEFEDHIAGVVRGCGLPVMTTALTGDFGVDLVVGRRPNRLAIQCKRQSRPVGPGAVQEVVAGAAMHDCAHTMVVSNQSFTPAAQRLAERHDCTLVGGSELTQLGRIIRRVMIVGRV